MTNSARYNYSDDYNTDVVQFWLNPDAPIGNIKTGNFKYFEREYSVQYLYCEECAYETPLNIAVALLKGLIADNKPHDEERMLVEYLMRHDADDKIALYIKEAQAQREELQYHTSRLTEATDMQLSHSRRVISQWKMSADERHALLVQAGDFKLKYGRSWYWDEPKNGDYAERVAAQRRLVECDLWDTFEAWFVLNYSGSIK